MPFTLPDLPFAKDALGDFMSAETLDFHHGKHHKAYVDKINALVAEKGLAAASLVERDPRAPRSEGDKRPVQQRRPALEPQLLLAMPRAARGAAADRAGSPRMIDEAFGSTDALLAKLKEEAVGHFASGWAWLVLDRGKLDDHLAPRRRHAGRP